MVRQAQNLVRVGRASAVPHRAASFMQNPRETMIRPRLQRLFMAKVGLEFRSPESAQCFFRIQTTPEQSLGFHFHHHLRVLEYF